MVNGGVSVGETFQIHARSNDVTARDQFSELVPRAREDATHEIRAAAESRAVNDSRNDVVLARSPQRLKLQRVNGLPVVARTCHLSSYADGFCSKQIVLKGSSLVRR